MSSVQDLEARIELPAVGRSRSSRWWRISRFLLSRIGIGIVMVCERKDPPGGLPSRDQITETLGQARLDALARRYLRDLRRSAYVDIRG